MDSAFSLSTTSLTLSTIPNVHKRYLSSISPTSHPCTRGLASFYIHNNPSFSSLASSLSALSVVFPLVHPPLECLSNSIASFSNSSIGAGATEGVSELSPEVIILDVGGMTSSGCAASVKRILENHAQVYLASVNLTKETAIVWPVSEAKVVPNWHKQLGDELAKHLTTCGFKSNLLDQQDAFCGCLKNTPHSDWGGHTFASLAPHDSELESYTNEVEALKVKVKDLLLDSTKELTHNIEFINLLCRLGVSYHFEDEINEQLNHIFTMLPKLLEDNDYDLCTLANLFRILRQHGYNMTCDVFDKFRDGDGEFKKDIAIDVKGILCLYEACFLAIPGEDILDQALAFTRNRLQVLAENSSCSLQKHIRNALMLPCHRNPERLDALHYISYYEEDEFANETLLKFAKLDFNGQQLLYRKELALLSKWWMDTNIMEKFPYVRDRLVESYLWALGCICEPQYGLARMMIAKYTILLTITDDTFDTYGTFEKLPLFAAAFQLLTEDAGDELPEYMKHIYKIILDDLENNGTKGCVFEDLENNGNKGCSYKTSYLKEMVKKITRCNLVEANWKKEGKAPSFDKYIKIGGVTCAYEILTSLFILGAENLGMKEILWLQTYPEIVIAAKFIGRLLNDICGRKDEKERQDFPKGVDCYMEQYGVSEDEAIEGILQVLENKWKVMNEEMVKPINMPRTLLKFSLNYARMTLVMNGGNGDVFTYSSNLSELITSMFINPLPM